MPAFAQLVAIPDLNSLNSECAAPGLCNDAFSVTQNIWYEHMHGFLCISVVLLFCLTTWHVLYWLSTLSLPLSAEAKPSV